MKKRTLFFLLILTILLAFPSCCSLYMGNRPAEGNPSTFIPEAETEGVIVNFGDSITHGVLSADYVQILRQEYPEYTFINAGINGELAWNLLQRSSEVIACDPDYITILAGTNDVLASLSPVRMKNYQKRHGIPVTADIEWYRENLEALIDLLNRETDAQIILISLPPVGEDRQSEAYRRAAEYSQVIRETASLKGTAYLPLNEEIDSILKKKAEPDALPFDPDSDTSMYLAVVNHYTFNKSWKEISDSNNLTLLTDTIHLNEEGASLISSLIGEYLISHPPSAR